MLPSSKPDKAEAKFAARLDVLTERVDTLAQTVATTASAMAKKDGEIAALRKELDARDERLADFITKARTATGGNEMQELKEAVAALAKDRSKGGGPSSKQLDDLATKVGQLGQRLETLSATVSTTAAGLAGREGELATIRKRLDTAAAPVVGATAPDPAMTQRVGDLASEVSASKLQLDGFATELAAVRTLVEQRAAEPQRPSEEIREMLTVLRSKVEELAGFRSGVTEEQLENRLAEAGERLQAVGQRIDALATTVDSAVSGLSDKEHELAALNRHFTESSARIESIVGDIRDALSALPEPGAASVDELVARMDRVVERVESFEAASRDAAEAHERTNAELSRRIDAIEQQVATVAGDVARAKTLWPVALRSLEARLDDVASHARRPEISSVPDPDDAVAGEDATAADDDLLAGLRDSLQAMETVAAEMARASDVLAPDAETDDDDHEPMAAAGGTIVPLRSPDG